MERVADLAVWLGVAKQSSLPAGRWLDGRRVCANLSITLCFQLGGYHTAIHYLFTIAYHKPTVYVYHRSVKLSTTLLHWTASDLEQTASLRHASTDVALAKVSRARANRGG